LEIERKHGDDDEFVVVVFVRVPDHEDEVGLLQPRRAAGLQVAVQRADLQEVAEPDARRTLLRRRRRRHASIN
jgi:hypothetical protein